MSLTVPKPVRDSVKLNVNLSDSADHYLPANQRYEVTSNSQSVYNTDDLLLMTKDGKGCVGEANVSNCWASKNLQYTDIDVVVKNEVDGKALEGKAVKLYSGAEASNYLGSQVTDKYGKVKFPKFAFD